MYSTKKKKVDNLNSKKQIITAYTLCTFRILGDICPKSLLFKFVLQMFIQVSGNEVRNWACNNFLFFCTSTKNKPFKVKQFSNL